MRAMGDWNWFVPSVFDAIRELDDEGEQLMQEVLLAQPVCEKRGCSEGHKERASFAPEDLSGPYLTRSAAARLLGVSTKRLSNMVSEGVLREGVHFTRPDKMRVRFIREALIAMLRNESDGRGLVGMAKAASKRSRCRVNLEAAR